MDEGKVEKNFEDSKETVMGVVVTVTWQILLFDSACVVILILFSVGISGIMVVRRNPKEIFSEMS